MTTDDDQMDQAARAARAQAELARELAIAMMNVLIRSDVFEIQMAALVGLVGECLAELEVSPIFFLHRVLAWTAQRRSHLAAQAEVAAVEGD